jgi:predicted outer membrane repeat protein
MSRTAGRLGIVAVIAALALGAPGLSHANFAPVLTITVTKTADDSGLTCTPGSCSLRGGITMADNQATGTLVKVWVPKGLYTLTNGSLTVDNPNGLIVEIDGAGAGVTKVDGSGNAPDTSDFVIDTPAQISGLTIENGTGDNGAGIDDEGGALTLNFSVVTHNRTNDAAGHGGGFDLPSGYWYVPITMANDTFSYNVSGQGGGVFTYNDTSLLNNVVIDHNIACDSFAVPTLSPFDAHNACLGNGTGGGLVIGAPPDSGENITINGGSITNNVAGSLVNDEGKGGGVWGDWRTTLNGVNVSNNVAGDEGGGFENMETGVVNGGKFVNNLAGRAGGAIGYDGDHTILSNVKFSNNIAGGRFECTETIDILSNPVSASCTQATGTQANPAATECVNGDTSTYQCTSDEGFGGAIESFDDISDKRSTFSGNRAVSVTPTGQPPAPPCLGEGGAIWQSDGVTLSGTIFVGNAASCGGGLYAAANGNPTGPPTTTSSVLFTTNRALFYGGAIFGESGSPDTTFLLNTTRVIANTAGVMTGGVFVQALGDLVIEGAPGIFNNTAPGACKNTNYPCS